MWRQVGGNYGSRAQNTHGEQQQRRRQRNEEKKMMIMSLSQKLTLGYAALVGAGGVMGYIKSGSQKSLAAGSLSATILFYVYSELPARPTFASALGLGLSISLLGMMGCRFKKTRKFFPAGLVSFVSFVMAGGYLHGFLHSWHA